MAEAEAHAIGPAEVIAAGARIDEEVIDLGSGAPLRHTTFPAHWLYAGEQRLDAGYYANAAFAAQRVVRDCGFEAQDLGQITRDIFILGRFRRVYATDARAGWPYLGASDALTFRPSSDRWIAKDHAPKDAQRHFARRGELLVSCSGSVGRAVVVTERLERYFLTHDLARIEPEESPPAGYLYAFLSSWIGQALLSKDQYGSAIKHLEPHHIAAIPVPLIDREKQTAIHDEIMRAYALRDEANDLLDEADALLHQELGLPRFDESAVPYLAPPSTAIAHGLTMPHPRAFTITAAALDDRLDASYHVPVVRTVVNLLGQGTYPTVRLRQIARSVSMPPRFKRIYVPKEHGIPFLRPSHLPQIRPFDLGYLSKLTDVLDALVLKKGDVLVTTDGAIGRIDLVSSRIAGWAGSNNIARVAYGNDDGRNGFLAAFLSTPYGYYQLTREIYGGVVDHIEPPQIENIWIPDAPPAVQVAIGQRMVRACEKKWQATVIEEAVIAQLEGLLA